MSFLHRKRLPRASIRADAGLLRGALAARSHPVESVLTGRSMGSAIPDGAVIRIHPAGAETWQCGRVVVCAAKSALIAHRIVHLGRGKAARSFILTHGDGNWICDAPSARAAVVGEVKEFRNDKEWRAVPPAALAPLRWLTAAGSRLLYVAALETHPQVALCLGAALTRARAIVAESRRRLAILGGHVRP